MPRARVFVTLIVAVLVTAGCAGGGGSKQAAPSVTMRSTTGTPLPPIYPGTTAPPMPSNTSAPTVTVLPTRYPTSTPATTPSAAPARTMPGDGVFRMGTDLLPGAYRSSGGESCYWERLRALTGRSVDVIAYAEGSGPQEVQIAPTDAAFKTQHCGTWSLVGAARTPTTPVTLPPGAQMCPESSGAAGGFAHSATGSSGTSCPFAERVRVSYGASGPASSTPRQVAVVSPATGETYTMTCSASEGLVVCRGGDNAVVYVY